jgi:hypothetical protein
MLDLFELESPRSQTPSAVDEGAE